MNKSAIIIGVITLVLFGACRDYESDAYTQQYEVDSAFTLKGYSGTVAEKYCNDSSLNFVSAGEVAYGDVDGSGEVDAHDAKLAKSLIGSIPTEEQLTKADVDDDGKITENDVNLILQAV